MTKGKRPKRNACYHSGRYYALSPAPDDDVVAEVRVACATGKHSTVAIERDGEWAIYKITKEVGK